MNVQYLDHLNLSVANFDETVAWYGRVFGFELMEEDVQNGVRWGTLRAGEALLCVYEMPDRLPPDSDTRKTQEHHGIAHFGLRVADAKQWEETVEREGVEVLYGGAVDWPFSTSWYIVDPTGYEIEVAHWHAGASRFAREEAA